MGKRKEIHVLPNSKRGGWDAKKNNADKASKHFDKKDEAMDWARQHAKENGAEIVPHGKDGRIQNPDSHGNDSCPPRDKK